MVGMNEIVSGKAITKYDVKEISTIYYGMCYIIIPIEIFMTSYVDSLNVLIAKNNTPKKDRMDNIMVQISPNNNFRTIQTSATGMNDEKISIKFDIQNKENHLNVDYAEEITEYINDCNEIGFFKCFATILAESNEFKCPKKCVTLAFQSMMETIDHNIPTCETDAEHYCMVGLEAKQTFLKLKSLCKKQCKNKGSKLVIKKSEYAYPHQLGSMQMTIQVRILPEIVYNKEYLIYDDIGMFGSIGGSLGLFLGFSLFDTLCMIVDFILRKINQKITSQNAPIIPPEITPEIVVQF